LQLLSLTAPQVGSIFKYGFPNRLAYKTHVERAACAR
jgi:hypothetical protein